jgi:hypothetical protein
MRGQEWCYIESRWSLRPMAVISHFWEYCCMRIVIAACVLAPGHFIIVVLRTENILASIFSSNVEGVRNHSSLVQWNSYNLLWEPDPWHGTLVVSNYLHAQFIYVNQEKESNCMIISTESKLQCGVPRCILSMWAVALHSSDTAERQRSRQDRSSWYFVDDNWSWVFM